MGDANLSLCCLVDGQFAHQVSAFDRGFAYGDGLFETMRWSVDRVPLLERHLARLIQGAERLGIPVNMGELRSDLVQMSSRLRQISVSSAVLRLTVTRGAGGRGYLPASDLVPTRVLAAHPYTPRADAAEGVLARICDTRLGLSPALAGLKHLGRLEQVLARMEWRDQAIAEGLMLSVDGRLIEGTMSNLFLVRGGRVATPDLRDAGVAGVMRGWLLEYLETTGRTAQVIDLSLSDLQTADEVFVCNSVMGIWPVTALNQWQWPVGQVTRALQVVVDELFV